MWSFQFEKPVSTWVVIILVILAGIGAVILLPIAKYPDVAPPTIVIRANYPGASAATMESSVTQIIEQQLTGIDGLLYFNSYSSSAGTAQVTITFSERTDPALAQTQVQNKVQQALPRLPQEVQQQGVTVTKASSDPLIIVSVYDISGRRTTSDMADFITSRLQDPLSRIPGVGDTTIFASQHAMRVWLDPDRLRSHGLMPSDVIAAIKAQNRQAPAGQIGGLPTAQGQQINAVVTGRARLSSGKDFRNILLRTDANGAEVRLGDVGRVELGAENYVSEIRLNGHPACGISIQLAPGADALKTAELVKAAVAKYTKNLPPNLRIEFPADSTAFIKASIYEVTMTLLEAIALVILVILLFIKKARATIIPALAIPVVLAGTFVIIYALGYTINTLTLFALVLAIGLLVDDAIIVVENVERLMHEEKLTAPAATLKSMREIRPALIGVVLVLCAIFLPMAFLSGVTGVIYRQFSVTIIVALLLSMIVAFLFTPLLTARFLRHEPARKWRSPIWTDWLAPLSRSIDARATGLRDKCISGAQWLIVRPWTALLAYLAIAVLLIVLMMRLPTGFLPVEDQGTVIAQYTLPPGATQAQTMEAARQIENYFQEKEKDNVRVVFTITGQQFGNVAQNVGQVYIALKPWDERKGSANTAAAITARANASLGAVMDARFFALTPPPVQGLGQSNDFTMQLVNVAGLSRDDFRARRDALLAAAAGDPALMAVRPSGLEDRPQLSLEIDSDQARALGVAEADADATLGTAWGGTYANDFTDNGHVKRVIVQGEAAFRSDPADLALWTVRSSSGAMVPLSAFMHPQWSSVASSLSRFNGLPSYEIKGLAAEGHSSGAAMERMVKWVGTLPEGTDAQWSGLSYHEALSRGQVPILYTLSLVVVFLSLAGLYGSWSLPISVLLAVPVGLIGAVMAIAARGMENDIFFQVGLVTIMGLSTKNAILIVEHAASRERQGYLPAAAAIEAVRVRLRPILMTSLAFALGVLPLAVASGAGAQSRRTIGTAVLGGTITATILTLFLVPVFYVAVRAIFARAAMARRSEQALPGSIPA